MADEENPSTMTDQHKGRIGSSGSESDSGHGVVGHDDIHVEENPKHGRTQQACDVGEPSNEPVKKPTPPDVEGGHDSPFDDNDMAVPLPPHSTRRRSDSTGLISDLINTIEDEGKSRGREYYKEETEWLSDSQSEKKWPLGQPKPPKPKKHQSIITAKITKIVNAVETESKEKGREYFIEENTWPPE